MIKLGNFPLGTSFDDIRNNALDKVKESMKTIDKASLHLDLVEIENCNGYDSETWQMFDPRHQKTILI